MYFCVKPMAGFPPDGNPKVLLYYSDTISPGTLKPTAGCSSDKIISGMLDQATDMKLTGNNMGNLFFTH